jgi:hypothetical protein
MFASLLHGSRSCLCDRHEEMQSKKRTPTGKSPAGVRAKDAIQGGAGTSKGTGSNSAVASCTANLIIDQLYRQL